MELRWYRSRPLPTMYLHRRRAQVSREQMAESRGRTTFLGNHLARGKAVLGIHNITVYDNGTYPCLFRDGEPHSETTLALQVAGEGCLSLRLPGSTSPQFPVPAPGLGYHPQCAVWEHPHVLTSPPAHAVSQEVQPAFPPLLGKAEGREPGKERTSWGEGGETECRGEGETGRETGTGQGGQRSWGRGGGILLCSQPCLGSFLFPTLPDLQHWKLPLTLQDSFLLCGM